MKEGKEQELEDVGESVLKERALERKLYEGH